MATRAHSTRTPLLPLRGARPPLLRQGSGKQPGPVTLALQAMQAADPDRIRALRKMIGDRIEADIALLDALSGDDEREADYLYQAHVPGVGIVNVGLSTDHEPSIGGDDRELDTSDDEASLGSLGSCCTPMDQTNWSAGGSEDCEAGDDNGIADDGGVSEQYGTTLAVEGSIKFWRGLPI